MEKTVRRKPDYSTTEPDLVELFGAIARLPSVNLIRTG